MAEQLCIFLRGVNVNGVKVKMEDLKKAFAGMGYNGARTVLATGNVIVSADSSDFATLKSEIEKHLGAAFNYDAHVFLRTPAELKDVVSAGKRIGVPPDCHLYYLICDDGAVLDELARVFASLPHKQNEAFSIIDSGAFWIVPVGETLESAFGAKTLGDRKYKDKLTSRNIKTIEKITNAMVG